MLQSPKEILHLEKTARSAGRLAPIMGLPESGSGDREDRKKKSKNKKGKKKTMKNTTKTVAAVNNQNNKKQKKKVKALMRITFLDSKGLLQRMLDDANTVYPIHVTNSCLVKGHDIVMDEDGNKKEVLVRRKLSWTREIRNRDEFRTYLNSEEARGKSVEYVARGLNMTCLDLVKKDKPVIEVETARIHKAIKRSQAEVGKAEIGSPMTNAFYEGLIGEFCGWDDAA